MGAPGFDPIRDRARIAEAAKAGRYVLSEHVVRALMSGTVTIPEIEAVLVAGPILEEHRHPTRRSSALLCGIRNGKPIHVVAAPEGEDRLVVTFAYVPGPPLWLDPRRRNPGAPIMTDTIRACFFCGANIKSVTVGNFDYRLQGKLYVVKKVPAGLCEGCGEKYIDAEVGRRLNELIESRSFQAREEVDVIQFQ